MLQRISDFRALKDGTTVSPLTELEKFLRKHQALSDERWKKKQDEKRAYVPEKQLQATRFNSMVAAVAKVLEQGRPTAFEHEGSCRHGLRGGLCVEGWSYADADLAASRVIEAALAHAGAGRPAWQDGQPEFMQDGYSPVPRSVCARCEKPLESDNVRTFFCSEYCQVAARRDREKVMQDRMTVAEHEASLVAKKALTKKQRELECDRCGKVYLPSQRYDGSRFCSKKCTYEALAIETRTLKNRGCAQCGTVFRPESEESRYCCRDALTRPAGHRRVRRLTALRAASRSRSGTSVIRENTAQKHASTGRAGCTRIDRASNAARYSSRRIRARRVSANAALENVRTQRAVSRHRFSSALHASRSSALGSHPTPANIARDAAVSPRRRADACRNAKEYLRLPTKKGTEDVIRS